MYKVRLITKGFSQKYSIDYIETFALVVKMNTVRVILAIVVMKDWQLHQFDVKNVFLNVNLEEVYICLPPGYEMTGQCCRLRKALYGLK